MKMSTVLSAVGESFSRVLGAWLGLVFVAQGLIAVLLFVWFIVAVAGIFR